MVAFLVLRQDDEVPAALVGFPFFLVHGATGHVHLASDDGLEQLAFCFGYFLLTSRHLLQGFSILWRSVFQLGQAFLQFFDFSARAAVLFAYIVVELFDAKHIAMVGDGDSFHAVFHGFVY